jgi:anti-sigma factor RsiW
MTREQLQELLPDYLGGELDAADRARFDESLREHPDLRAEVKGLCDTIGAMRSLEGRHDRRTLVSSRSSAKRGAFAALRYAAVIAAAFAVGYFVRGIGSTHSNEIDGTQSLAAVDAGNRSAPRTELEHRLAEGYARGSGAGTALGRSLIALAHATDTTSR